jgi:pyruvate formate lyase activating enzyme
MSTIDNVAPIAAYQESLGSGKVACHLCPVECVLGEGKIGVCRGKQNIAGVLYAINYGYSTSLAIDPIEKKPLYHFYPGSPILSIGPNGCNLKCNFCQNFSVSQEPAVTSFMDPQRASNVASICGSIGLAYTYSEPLIWFEYVRDTAQVVREGGMVNVLVTNGSINREPLEELLPFIDAMNIDIKSMDLEFYRKICKGKLDPVLQTVRQAVASGTHVEITNLVIPGLNDSDDLFHALADFIAEIDPLIPLHFSRYHPDYRQTAPATPESTLVRALTIASEKLKHVYIGNVISDQWNQTRCPNCGEVIVGRQGYTITFLAVHEGVCDYCGTTTGVVTE